MIGRRDNTQSLYVSSSGYLSIGTQSQNGGRGGRKGLEALHREDRGPEFRRSIPQHHQQNMAAGREKGGERRAEPTGLEKGTIPTDRPELVEVDVLAIGRLSGRDRQSVCQLSKREERHR